MLQIEFEGFVANIKAGEDDYLQGTVRDTHEFIEVQGLTLKELRSDFADKIADYKRRCNKRGIEPFATPNGKSTAEIDALDAEMYSGELSDEHPAWPHRHTYFYDGKAQAIRDNIIEFDETEATAVPPHLRFPLDDIVDELRQRSRPPRLLPGWELPENTKTLNLLVRYRLAEAFEAVSKADPRNRDDARDDTLDFLSYAREVQEKADAFYRAYRTGFSILPTFHRGLSLDEASHRFDKSYKMEQDLIHFLQILSEMMSWAYQVLDDAAPAHGGRPRLSWRYDFIAGFAALWRQITGRKPSYNPDGLFTRFIEAAWESGGQGMPDVPWDRVISRYRLVLKEKEAKTSHSGD